MSASPAVIKQTQESLGKFIKKPPLTEKLLSKPPFRFLHDVFTIAMKDTGAMQGLFEDVELDSNNVKEKEAKVLYLSKIIDCLSLATDTNLQAKPGKIVSGQEPEKTNQLLQALANVIENKIDTTDAVARVKNGEKPDLKKKPAKKKEIETKTTKKTPDKKNRENKENRENNRRSSGKPTSKTGAKESPKKPKPKSPSPEPEPEQAPDSLINDEPEPPPLDMEPEEEPPSLPPAPVEMDLPSFPPLINGEEEMVSSAELHEEQNGPESPESAPPRRVMSSRPQTVKDRKKSIIPTDLESDKPNPEVLGQMEDDDPIRPSTAMRAGSARPRTGRARPPSARPAPPKIRERKEVAEEPRPATAKPVANLILDTEADDDDADEFLIEEAPKDPLVSLDSDPLAEVSAVQSSGEEHGVLVQQILETQKELQDGNKTQKGVEIERDEGVGEAGRIRDRAGTQREVDKLRTSIQTLTRSANPLGKLMDFLQEDVDSMQRELDTWTQENKQLQLQLRHEEKLTQETLQPLNQHLNELFSAVQDQLDKISVVKSNILRNEEKIAKMISTIGVSQR
ncbi:TRAF3-interacting protein 1 [Eurytemora carolleeae]|uniref:TRAF3-interacting protein 1 n=1 Tax=Eurytemora carolleeae TaxID=1294199 RepID=UPI000C77D7C4|nr:TRAF3-interacting protein 1 [Eurytemora carolleeae]|eukprot:XP_023345382.1 TRAF3-interacting protein 1-like [Eurytemora affinis]